MTSTSSYDEYCSDQRFISLVKKKRYVSFVLFGVAMALFFSIPLISSFYPAFFKMQAFGSINVGLSYLILQYIAGGLIAWRYSVIFGEIDKETNDLVAELHGKPHGHAGV